LMRRITQFHRDGEVKSGGATAKAENLHGKLPCKRASCADGHKLAPGENNFKLKISGLKNLSGAP
ncbi:MAG: hypothetical protein KA139_05750, partial [Rhodobacteraceae bacterium]|nr:hypothetical protein [Paracoccaceae bacterium]